MAMAVAVALTAGSLVVVARVAPTVEVAKVVVEGGVGAADGSSQSTHNSHAPAGCT